MRRGLAALIAVTALVPGLTFAQADAAPRPVLVFVSNHESRNFDLRIKYSDGTISGPLDLPSATSVAANLYTSSSTPSVSPDGTKIAFVGWNRACSGTSCPADSRHTIYTMNVDGSDVTPIYRMHDESFEWVLDTAWSPDGKRIMFTVNYKKIDGRRRLPDLWVIDEGQDGVWVPSPLSARPGREYWPEWSPDGRYVAYNYVSDRDGFSPTDDHKTNTIAVSPVDGGGPHRTLARSSSVTDAAFSPDGKWIAYADYSEPGAAKIRVMRRDGSDKRTIVREVLGPWSLDYSPDGRFIVFGEGIETQFARIVKVQVASPHRRSVVVDFEGAYDHMPEYFPLP